MAPVNSVSEGGSMEPDRKALGGAPRDTHRGRRAGRLFKNLVSAGKFGGSLFVLLRPIWE